jgi:putative ABC transport system ATP-binding protein
VACARALITRPDVVFADEPTGNLDSRSGAEVLGFLRRSVREFGQTVVMVTHDPLLRRTPTGGVPGRRACSSTRWTTPRPSRSWTA